MNERINLIRKKSELNQEEMGNRLGVTKATISRIEKGITNITEQMIKSICREFNVNEDWLRNGTGEMFVKTSNELLDQLAAKYNLKDAEKQAFQALLELSEEDRDKIGDLIRNIFGGFFPVNADDTISATKEAVASSIAKDDEVTATQQLDEDPFVKYEVDAYRQEIIATQKGETSSVSENSEEKKDLA